jgi:hypothetical protein
VSLPPRCTPATRFVRNAGFARTAVLLASAAVCLIAAAVHANDTAPHAVDESSYTKEAVIAVDQHWLEAEVSGDVAWIDRMLLPEYRSVSADGTAHPKSAILASARKNGQSDEMRRKVEAWQKAHPSKKSVVLRDNVAILSFYDPALGPQNGVNSSDIFLYIDGSWHALYSQHSAPRTKE